MRVQQNKIRTHLKLLKTPPIFKLINQSAYRNEDVGYEDAGTKGRCMLIDETCKFRMRHKGEFSVAFSKIQDL